MTRLAELRKAILTLGRYSRWPREELRSMTPDEFASYVETANSIIEENGT